jgi:hypothetical protein
MNKIINRFAIVVLSLAFIILVYFSYLALWPMKTCDLIKLQTMKPVYRHGDTFDYLVEYNKHTSLPGTAIRSFEDGFVYQIPEITTDNPKGHHSKINTSLIIPECLPAGEYVMKMTITYHLNLFRDESKRIVSNKFKVIN